MHNVLPTKWKLTKIVEGCSIIALIKHCVRYIRNDGIILRKKEAQRNSLLNINESLYCEGV